MHMNPRSWMVAVVLLMGVGLTSPGQATAPSPPRGATATDAQSESRPEPWQTSWDAFVDLVQDHYSRGQNAQALEAKIVGKTAVWEGKFRKVAKPDFTFGGPSTIWYADVTFAPRRIRMNGVEMEVIPPSIATSADQLSRWQKLAPGTVVHVRLTFRTANMLNTLLLLDTRTAGKETISFMPQEGELLMGAKPKA